MFIRVLSHCAPSMRRRPALPAAVTPATISFSASQLVWDAAQHCSSCGSHTSLPSEVYSAQPCAQYQSTSSSAGSATNSEARYQGSASVETKAPVSEWPVTVAMGVHRSGS